MTLDALSQPAVPDELVTYDLGDSGELMVRDSFWGVVSTKIDYICYSC